MPNLNDSKGLSCTGGLDFDNPFLFLNNETITLEIRAKIVIPPKSTTLMVSVLQYSSKG